MISETLPPPRLTPRTPAKAPGTAGGGGRFDYAYFTDAVLAHLGGQPFKRFEPSQRQFECLQDIGYKDFQAANAEVDELFIASVKKLAAARGTPIVLAIAGPTAAGKTEIVARLQCAFEQAGQRVREQRGQDARRVADADAGDAGGDEPLDEVVDGEVRGRGGQHALAVRRGAADDLEEDRGLPRARRAATRRSDAPLITSGWRVKSSVLFT